MLFNPQNPYDLERADAYYRKLRSGQAPFEIRRKAHRTLSQNSYLHLLLGYFGSQYGCSLDEVKIDIYKRTCNRDLFERTKVNRQGREVTFLRSSAELTTAEMSLSIDRFRNFASSEAGIYLPSPNEREFLIYIQQEIERHKEFL